MAMTPETKVGSAAVMNMRRHAAIKAACIGAAILLLVEVMVFVGGYALLRPPQDRRELVGAKQLRSDLYMYVIRDDPGGATVPFRFKYYFWSRRVDADGMAAVMDRQAPFLVASNESAEVNVAGDDVAVAFSGRIYDFSNVAAFYVGDDPRLISVKLTADPESIRP
ncbi:hypothetical protein [Burkholderia latens]|uniref:hypothetical protein n=1 Tax=Burkholderia latens TaxID=488446 RepID=UPI00158D7713|nr:hypothetical protein [Burkholderia latens]